MELERNGAVSCSHIFPYTAILLLVSLDVPVVYRIDVRSTVAESVEARPHDSDAARTFCSRLGTGNKLSPSERERVGWRYRLSRIIHSSSRVCITILSSFKKLQEKMTKIIASTWAVHSLYKYFAIQILPILCAGPSHEHYTVQVRSLHVRYYTEHVGIRHSTMIKC